MIAKFPVRSNQFFCHMRSIIAQNSRIIAVRNRYPPVHPLLKTRTDGIVCKLNIEGASAGSLHGYTFVAKDLFDVAGFVTGAGNPDWSETHAAASQNAKAVSDLLNAGAWLRGKSCTDELAYSIDGINVHYGAPLNPQFPDRVSGGSSSGSGSAVAARLVDFALGTDTGGSIRIPASYCGIYGFRPTHGRISLEGTVPLAPEFDTVGWLARDAELLKKCGMVLMQEAKAAEEKVAPSNQRSLNLLVATDLIGGTKENIRNAINAAIKHISKHFSQIENIELSQICGTDVVMHYRILQGWQAWKTHGNWIETTNPNFAPPIRERFELAKKVTTGEFEASSDYRTKLVKNLSALLASGTVLCLPTNWDLPPRLTASSDEFAQNRMENMKLTAIAPLAGMPQVTVPVRLTDTTKTGLSFMAGSGEDLTLLELCQTIGA